MLKNATETLYLFELLVFEWLCAESKSTKSSLDGGGIFMHSLLCTLYDFMHAMCNCWWCSVFDRDFANYIPPAVNNK